MKFDRECLPVKVIKSKRRTIAIEVKPEGIVVRAPYGLSDQMIQKFLQEKRGWIEKHQKAMVERRALMEQVEPYSEEEIHALAQKALEVIPKKVKHYASQIGVEYGRITIRNQRTRWGSCSGKGNLNFNCLLMLFPDEVIDSVVVHELCHRKHMNHSAEFYMEVEKVFPRYRSCQKWLKEHGGMYLARLR